MSKASEWTQAVRDLEALKKCRPFLFGWSLSDDGDHLTFSDGMSLNRIQAVELAEWIIELFREEPHA